MKPFTSFKVLTLVSLIVYSGSVFAQGAAPSTAANGVLSYDPDAAGQSQFAACMSRLNLKLQPMYNAKNKDSATAFPFNFPKMPSDLNYKTVGSAQFPAEFNTIDPDFYSDVSNCVPNTMPNTDGQSCTKQESEIDDAVKALTKDCSHAPKVSSDAVGDSDTAATADWVKDTHGTWGTCLQDAYSCNKFEYGDNDSADSCADSSLDDLAKNGAKPDELKSYCQNKYPAQCGALDRASLRTTAKDLNSDLTAELKDLNRDLAEKKKELQDNKDKLDAADKQQQGFAAKALQDTKDLQTQYEAQVKASGAQIDSTLENSYKLVGVSQNAVKSAAGNVTEADAAKFDAQNKFAIVCKAQAKAKADNLLPTGAVNYGGQNALVTRNARWQKVYTATLQSLYADGTTCDGGNYANATLKLLNMQRAQVQAEANVQKAQSDLQLAMQKNTMKKDDESLSLLIKQRDKVSQLAAKQKQDYQDITTKEYTLRKNAATMQEDINKLQAKIDNAPKKKACIQTIRSCSNVAGIPSSSSSSSAADVADAMNAVDNVISICKSAAKVCTVGADKSLPTKETSLAAFNTTFPGGTLGSPPSEDLPFDTNKSVCAQAIASKMEENGPLNKSKARMKHAPKTTTDVSKQKGQ